MDIVTDLKYFLLWFGIAVTYYECSTYPLLTVIVTSCFSIIQHSSHKSKWTRAVSDVFIF